MQRGDTGIAVQSLFRALNPLPVQQYAAGAVDFDRSVRGVPIADIREPPLTSAVEPSHSPSLRMAPEPNRARGRAGGSSRRLMNQSPGRLSNGRRIVIVANAGDRAVP